MNILCLANSLKEQGRCLAGIQLDDQNHPVIHNNRPVWIRPTGNTEHGQIPLYLCAHISVLDVIDIGNTSPNGQGYQSENVTFDENSLDVVSRMPQEILDSLCENDGQKFIFGNISKAISEEHIVYVEHSLMLVKITDFEVIKKMYPNKTSPKFRLRFSYNQHQYELPITDPPFLDKCKRDSQRVHLKKTFDG